MNTRERFLSIMDFERPDRLPVVDSEGFIEETIRLWCAQGFPASMNVEDYFGLELVKPYRGTMEIDFGPIPSFVERTLEVNQDYVIRVNRFGYTERRSRTLPMRSYGYTAFPIANRGDWEEMKRRYDPRDPRRYPRSWGQEFIEHCNRSDRPVGLGFTWGPGRGPKGGYGMGVRKFLSTFARDPDWIRDMFRSYADYVIELARPLVKEVKLDYVSVEEDGMAYANGPLVSPSIYSEFYLPHVKRVLDFFREHGVKILAECSSGNITPLIPLFLEAGYNLFWPVESAAGMDALKLRDEYGDRLMLLGNISKNALMSGKRAVEKEFNAKVPPLVEQGGYIPAVDDMILPDISFESYSHYIKLVKEFRPG